jgi:hypothetical protein
MHSDIPSLVLRFVVSFVSVQAIAVAGCIIAFKKHRSSRTWIAVLAAMLYLNCAYLFLFNPVNLRQQLGAAIDYALIYPFFAYMLICMALVPLFVAAAAVSGISRAKTAFAGTNAAAAPGYGYNGQRREFLKMMTAGIALPVAAPSLYGLYVGSAQMKTDDVSISFPDLPAGLDGLPSSR